MGIDLYNSYIIFIEVPRPTPLSSVRSLSTALASHRIIRSNFLNHIPKRQSPKLFDIMSYHFRLPLPLFPPPTNKFAPRIVGKNLSTTSSPSPTNRRSTSRQTNTTTPQIPTLEHGRIAQHIRHNEEAHVRTANIHLLEVGNAAVASGDSDVF